MRYRLKRAYVPVTVTARFTSAVSNHRERLDQRRSRPQWPQCPTATATVPVLLRKYGSHVLDASLLLLLSFDPSVSLPRPPTSCRHVRTYVWETRVGVHCVIGSHHSFCGDKTVERWLGTYWMSAVRDNETTGTEVRRSSYTVPEIRSISFPMYDGLC